MEHLGTVKHLDTAALQAGLGHVRESPPDHGTVEMIVRCMLASQASVLGRVESSTGASGYARASSRQHVHAGQSSVPL